MVYVIILSVIVVVAFFAIAAVLLRDNGEHVERRFTQLPDDKQRALYSTPVKYDDDTQTSWRQKGLVRNVTPNSDDTAQVDLMWYNGQPDKTPHKGETNVEHIHAKKKDVQAKGLKAGDIVTIHVQPGQGVTIVAD